jgi:peptide/nickel transport system permease protein
VILYVLRRILQSLLTIFGVMLVTFLLFRVGAGDIAAAQMGQKATQREKQEWRHKHGYDLPWLINLDARLRIHDLSGGSGAIQPIDSEGSNVGDALGLIVASLDDLPKDAPSSLALISRPVTMLDDDTPLKELTDGQPLLKESGKAELVDLDEPEPILRLELSDGSRIALDLTGIETAGQLAQALNDHPLNDAEFSRLTIGEVQDWDAFLNNVLASKEEDDSIGGIVWSGATELLQARMQRVHQDQSSLREEDKAILIGLLNRAILQQLDRDATGQPYGSLQNQELSGEGVASVLYTQKRRDLMKQWPGVLQPRRQGQRLLAVRESFELRDAFNSQFFRHLKTSVTFSARSFTNNQSLREIIVEKAPYSLALTIPAMVLGWVISLAIASFVAYFRGTWIDRTGVFLSVLGMCVPFLAFMIFGQWLMFRSRWASHAYGVFSKVNIYLPITIMVIAGLGGRVRFYRTIILDQTGQDYVRTAKAKGAAVPNILFRHVLRNCMLPILTNLIMTIPFLIMGSLLVESYFGIPGLGGLILSSIQGRDEPILNGMVFLTAVIYTFSVLITDLSYALFDPRVRLR